MKTYDVYFKNVNEGTIQLLFTPHNSDEEERPEDVVGTIVANDLNDAKHRLEKLLKTQL